MIFDCKNVLAGPFDDICVVMCLSAFNKGFCFVVDDFFRQFRDTRAHRAPACGKKKENSSSKEFVKIHQRFVFFTAARSARADKCPGTRVALRQCPNSDKISSKSVGNMIQQKMPTFFK